MNQPNERHLQNQEIAEIFKSGNASLTSRVFAEIETRYKAPFFRQILKNGHHRLSDETLNSLAEEAFSEMQRIFYDRVRSGKFDAKREVLRTYLYRIFFNQYMNFFRKELTELDYRSETGHWHRPDGQAETLLQLNKPGGMNAVFQAAMAKLSPACRELFASRTKKESGRDDRRTVQQRYVCKQKLEQILKQDFGLEF